jgi:hypothetical protein
MTVYQIMIVSLGMDSVKDLRGMISDPLINNMSTKSMGVKYLLVLLWAPCRYGVRVRSRSLDLTQPLNTRGIASIYVSFATDFV